ncbi:hypothetical protein [Paenibacillus polymyxa]|uniref:hypothetical protein n=2 Tax=Paenibacillus TaxID=44249 RepID=UPI0025B6445A|nr:hypothetical protein [Paenibacillus polymyxa]MDN4081213.1 hypothetical protein [Paenibacillus polymyxa]MDN4106915.1 hypothetical protein [Paenibacillus polymyxa]MDN4116853.1 hypothetical protein [Paenibacillus polymyxa]
MKKGILRGTMIDDEKDVSGEPLDQGEETHDSGKSAKFMLPENWDSMLQILTDIQNHRPDRSDD